MANNGRRRCATSLSTVRALIYDYRSHAHRKYTVVGLCGHMNHGDMSSEVIGAQRGHKDTQIQDLVVIGLCGQGLHAHKPCAQS